MKVVITGSRELQYCEPFALEGQQLAATAQRSRERSQGRKLTQTEMGAVLQLGTQCAVNAVTREVCRQLDDLHSREPITRLAHGGARGIDRVCAAWAIQHGIETVEYKPRWMRDGVLDRTAGFKRNWWMLFSEAGKNVSASFDRKTGVVARQSARIDRLISRAKDKGLLHRLPYLVALREPLADSFHPARRSVLRRVGAAIPEDVVVIGFHDGQSRGTAHCLMAARQLGFEVICHEYTRPEYKPKLATDLTKIDHRPQPLEALGWYGVKR